MGFPCSASGRESAWQCRRCKRHRFNPWVRKIPLSRKWKPTPVFLPGKSQGQRRLAGYSPWGPEESDTIECLSTNTETRGKQKSNSAVISQNPSSSSRDAYSSIFEFFYRNQVPYPVIPGIPPFDVTTNQSEESLTRSPPAILPIRPLPTRHGGVRIFPIQAICSPFLALVINLSLLQTLTFWFFWLHCTGHTKLTLDSKWYEKMLGKGCLQFGSVQALSRVRLFATP